MNGNACSRRRRRSGLPGMSIIDRGFINIFLYIRRNLRKLYYNCEHAKRGNWTIDWIYRRILIVIIATGYIYGIPTVSRRKANAGIWGSAARPVRISWSVSTRKLRSLSVIFFACVESCFKTEVTKNNSAWACRTEWGKRGKRIF